MRLLIVCFTLFSICLQGKEFPIADVPSPFLEIVSQMTLVKLPATPDGRSFDKMVKWLRHSHVGNVLISKINFGDGTLDEQARRISSLTMAIYERTRLVPLKASDQEGGRVQHVLGTRIPAPMIMEDDKIEIYANILAMESKKVGVNLCLGPVLDVPAEGNFIGNRAFGSDPETVINRARRWIGVLRENGLLAVGKHFPGHGSTKENTHRDAAFVDKTEEELINWDMKPFIALMPELDALMSGHVLYPALDPHHIGTYSSKIMTGLLRDYRGIRITDSLGMLAATPEQTDFEQTAMAMATNAIKAIKAGCDLVILGTPQFGPYVPPPGEHMKLVDRIMVHMAHAFEQGRVPRGRLEDALQRIQSGKEKIATSQQQEEISSRFAALYELLNMAS